MLYQIYNSIRHMRTFIMGLAECKSDFGMTWEEDLDKCEAYDFGRYIGHKIYRIT